MNIKEKKVTIPGTDGWITPGPAGWIPVPVPW
jgi:hypothetical protein